VCQFQCITLKSTPGVDYGSRLVTTCLAKLVQLGAILKLKAVDETQVRVMMASDLDRAFEGAHCHFE
jgi:hypothetical protein